MAKVMRVFPARNFFTPPPNSWFGLAQVRVAETPAVTVGVVGKAEVSMTKDRPSTVKQALWREVVAKIRAHGKELELC